MTDRKARDFSSHPAAISDGNGPADSASSFLFLTARNEEEDILRGFELRGADYVTKPFRAAELLARVRTHLELAQARKLILLQNKELREMNRLKDKLFSILAHDMKSPLTAFREIADILLNNRDKLDEEGQTDLIATIQQAAEKLLALLDNVFIWSQSQSGRLEYAPCQHPVLPSIKETFSLFALIGQPGAVVK